jgi:benzoate-CoA ligase family protein
MMPLVSAANILYHNIVDGREQKPAVFCSEKSWTYGELVALAGRVGNALSKFGIERENRVALLLMDGVEFIASFYGAIAIGAVPVPLNTSLTTSDYLFLLTHGRAKAPVISAAFAHLIGPIRENCPFLRHIIVADSHGSLPDGAIDWQTWVGESASELVPVELSPDEPAFWLYSSGSTGRPKAVIYLHRAIPSSCDRYAQQVLGLRESDVLLSATKLFHAYGLGNGMNFPLAIGASTVLWHGTALPEAMFEMISRLHPTVFFATPALFAGMLALERGSQYDLASLRFCVSAGEALPASIFKKWKDRFGLEIIDGIGSTEMLHIFISNRPGETVPGSSGKVVLGYHAKIVDEDGIPVAIGQVGDLWVKGESSAIAYWLDHYHSQQVMRGEWVVTGDKYRQDEEGYFWYKGRTGDMFKVNGVWVSPIELENILNEHPSVTESAVIGIRDRNELMQLKAFVVLTPTVEPGSGIIRELQAFIRRRQPQRYPRMFELVQSLPKTVTGKIKRFKLREIESKSQD